VSTDYVFSGTRTRPWQENSKANPVSVYGASKYEGEKLVKIEYPEKSFIVRTAWLYSENSHNFARKIVRLALKDSETIRVVDDQIGQPTYAGDLALKIIELIDTEAPIGIYHGTNSGKASWFDFAVEIFKHCGADIKRIIPITTNELKSKVQRPEYSVLGHSSWKSTKCGEMRDWKLALGSAIPEIIRSVKE
jgi:dTDP-4-dehydrorhamnose reductase